MKTLLAFLVLVSATAAQSTRILDFSQPAASWNGRGLSVLVSGGVAEVRGSDSNLNFIEYYFPAPLNVTGNTHFSVAARLLGGNSSATVGIGLFTDNAFSDNTAYGLVVANSLNSTSFANLTIPWSAGAHFEASRVHGVRIFGLSPTGSAELALAFDFLDLSTGVSVPVPPVIIQHPASQSVARGSTLVLSVAAEGVGPFIYQWFLNGQPIGGQTTSSLTIGNIQPSQSGTYSVSVSNGTAISMSNIANVEVLQSTSVTSRIVNVSVRTVLAGGQNLQVGISMTGGLKPVLLRAVGPGLAQFGVSGTMPDPKFTLNANAIVVDSNDNWGGTPALTAAMASLGAFPLLPNSLDAALLRSVQGGATAVVNGSIGGDVIVEAYDAGSGNLPRLNNVSARNRVGSGSDKLIAGIVISGTGSKTVLIRGIGPSLSAFGVPGVLQDPKIEVFRGDTKVAENDNWSESLSRVFTEVGAFSLIQGSKDAAIVLTLSSGSYTALLSGADGGVGEGLIEVYEIP